MYEKFDSPQLITFSLGAASTLQLVIDIEQGCIPSLDIETGKQIILDMINISYCVRYLQNSHLILENLKFYTIEKAYANRKSQNKISDYIAWDDGFHRSADRDCNIFKE